MKKMLELSGGRFVILSLAAALTVCLCSCADKPTPIVQRDSVKVEPVKVEPVKTVAVKVQPIKVEPVKTEPPKKAEPTKAIQAAVVVPVVVVPAVVAPMPVVPVRGSIKGTVTILGKNSERLPAGEVVVTLEPLFPVSAASKQQKTYEIAMVDKKYTPGVITIKPGDTVKFNNKDSIKHNVFSSSGNNAFELGTYGFGVAEGATLKYPGIVKVYCNIHAGMAAFVSVSESGYSFITKDNGQFIFNELPVGEYRVKVWHVRGEAEKSVQVSANQSALGDIVINSAAYVPETHMNKYGKPYKAIPTLFKDEFY